MTLTIKISARGGARNAQLSQFLGNPHNRLDDCQFVVNDHVDEADFWFVCEDLDDDDRRCRVPRSRVIFLSAETAWPASYYADSPARTRFLRQFAQIHSCHDIVLEQAVFSLPFLPWMINANHGEAITAPHSRDASWLGALTSLSKTRLVSVICSTQTLTPSHRMRLRFVERLAAHLGDDLDWFGNGVRDLPEKWDGIAPYRYHIALENRSDTHIVTEKLYDAYLGLAYPIYWGAPDVSAVFDDRALTAIDIRDWKRAIAVIDEVLASDLAEQRQTQILANRDRVLGELNVYRRIAAIAQRERALHGDQIKESVELWPIDPFHAFPGRPLARMARLPDRLRSGLRR